MTSPDAHSDETTPNTSATHRVHQARHQHGARCANGVAVSHSATVDIQESSESPSSWIMAKAMAANVSLISTRSR